MRTHTSDPSRWLAELERRRDAYDGEARERKLGLLRSLRSRRLATPRAVSRLHECLLYLRAYPDSRDLLDLVDAMLEEFAERPDLRRHRRALAESGIAGTILTYAFYFPTALWLARRWPEHLHVDWDGFEDADRLLTQLPLLVPFSETPALDLLEHSVRQWLARLKGPGETDGAFLVRRFERIRADPFVRQALFEQHDPVLRIEPGLDTPSRTRARVAKAPVVFQRRPLDRARPDLPHAVMEKPRAVRAVSARDGEMLVDLARGAMITRARDLDAFMHADPRDVRLVDFGDGLQFAALGVIPERRLLLESVYGFLTLKNGVPIGYVLASALYRSSEVAYNVFETFRGGESALHFGRVLAMVRHLFGSDTFTLDPYQLGYGNDEGLRSGAWWFYYKLGFRPDDPAVRRLVKRELASMARNPRHRSSRGVLERLASAPVFWSPGAHRRDVLGRIDLGRIGLAVSRGLAERFGADRERGLAACAEDAARVLEVSSFRGWSPGARLAWERWGPVVAALDPGGWSRQDRAALAAVIRAKGDRRESDFVAAFDAHPRVRAGLLALASRRG